MHAFGFEHPRVLWTILAIVPILLLGTIRSRAENSGLGRRVSLLVRISWVIVLVVAAAVPVWTRTKSGQATARVYVLRDMSRSVGDASPQTDTIEQQLHEAIGPGMEVVDLNFAARPWRTGDPAADVSQTNIEAALNFANLQSLGISDVKVVLISDGHSTRGDAVEAASRLSLRGAVVHAIPIGNHRPQTVHIVRADPPVDSHIGMPASAKVTIASEQPVRVEVKLVDSRGAIVDQRSLPVEGQKTLILHFTPKNAGVEVYSVRVDIAPGAHASAIADTKPISVSVQGPPHILICDNFPDELSALIKAMEPLKVPVDLMMPDKWPKDLSPYAAVVISDWSGKELSDDQRKQLRKYVEEEGGGLVFIGGGNVVPARWKQNPIAEMLPVVLREKPADMIKRSSDSSIVFVVDRSGSMGEILGGGAGVSKMDMVKAAIIASVQTLPEKTQVGVVSFDSQPTILVPATDVSKKDEITREVETLRPGGGTMIEPAIRQGMSLLATMPGKKYLIVLTDGIGERPASDLGYWGAVADDAKKARISWTSVAVGADADQTLLSFLASETHGKFFFCDTGDKIPKVFLQQTQAIKKIQEQKEKSFQPVAGSAIAKLKDLVPAEMPELDGRVHATAKKDVDVVLLGEGTEPLLAGWQFGLGRVVAFTSDAKGGWGKDWVAWKGYSPFWLQTVQDVMRINPKLHARVRGHVVGGQAIYNFDVTDQEGHAADSLKTTGDLTPQAAPDHEPDKTDVRSVPVEWKQLGPGQYQASAEVPADGSNYLLSLSLEREGHGKPLKFLATVSNPADAEMAETGPDIGSLNAIAGAGQGVCDSDPDKIGKECRTTRQREVTERIPFWRAMVIAALLLWTVDVAVRKFF